MNHPPRLDRPSLQNLIRQVDAQVPGAVSPDTVPTGFASVDRVLGGGLRGRDLIVLGGDVGAGKSAFALALAPAAQAGFSVVPAQNDEDRLLSGVAPERSDRRFSRATLSRSSARPSTAALRIWDCSPCC
jgi:replicative DNA helicase